MTVGPAVTCSVSLATLLSPWWWLLRLSGAEPSLVDYLRPGAVSVPLVPLASTAALWLSLRVVGT